MVAVLIRAIIFSVPDPASLIHARKSSILSQPPGCREASMHGREAKMSYPEYFGFERTLMKYRCCSLESLVARERQAREFRCMKATNRDSSK